MVFNRVIDFMLSLVFIIITYFIGMSVMTELTNRLIDMGAPAAVSLYYIHLMQWGFIIFLAAAFIILFARVYKKEYDTGRFRGYD